MLVEVRKKKEMEVKPTEIKDFIKENIEAI
jgi:hypothetical protein